jgi:hypothetical protein
MDALIPNGVSITVEVRPRNLRGEEEADEYLAGIKD